MSDDYAGAPIDVLVLGIGNTLMGDEGVGVHAVDALQRLEPPGGVECLDGGTASFQLLEPLGRARRVIMVDATVDGRDPGTIGRTQPRYATDYPPTLTAHDIGLKDLLEAFHLTGAATPVVLYTVSISPSIEPGLELSEPVAAAVPGLVDEILRELAATV